MARATRFVSPAFVKVTTAGTAVPLEASSVLEAHAVIIQALSSNEGTICVGDKNVKAAAGSHAEPTQRGIALTKGQSISVDHSDLSQLWIDATISGDAVCIGVSTA